MLMLAMACSTGPTRHLDGEGPVEWVGSPDGFTVGIQTSASPNENEFSFGAMILCRAAGGENATINSVEPLATIGDGFDFLGAMVRDARAPYGGVISSAGFPPEGANESAYREAVGATIEVQCQTASQGLELVIGFEKIGDSGGGWEGVDVHYSLGEREYVLEINNLMVLCPPAQDCAEYVESVES
jgi:hypothetical protein